MVSSSFLVAGAVICGELFDIRVDAGAVLPVEAKGQAHRQQGEEWWQPKPNDPHVEPRATRFHEGWR